MWSLREEERAVWQQVLAVFTFTHAGTPSFWASVCTLYREGVMEVQWAPACRLCTELDREALRAELCLPGSQGTSLMVDCSRALL